MSLFADNAGGSLIVHSHLRWDFVWQRPQQLLSRFSERAPVLFVEEPIYVDNVGTGSFDLSRPLPNVYRAVPLLPVTLRDQYDASIGVVREMLGRLISEGQPLAELFARPVQWFYTPMPPPAMIGAFHEVGVVYDCMDELSKCRFAPSELVDREAYLMAEADVVFAGGYRLAQAKSKRHKNVHFFGCGVDAEHFGGARRDGVDLPQDIANLLGPVVGYYGVIDERVDYELIAALANALPEVSIAMVGPVVKVDPAELPRAENIHWLGQRAYDALPGIVKGFDVCLMPFARNEATEYINPTKTLEYMAAGKPIVSTAIPDVVQNFTPVVAIAESAGAFVTEVQAALQAPSAELIERGLEQARHNSWESIVWRMQRIIDDTVGARANRGAADRRTRRSTSQTRVVRPRTFASVSEDASA